MANGGGGGGGGGEGVVGERKKEVEVGWRERPGAHFLKVPVTIGPDK